MQTKAKKSILDSFAKFLILFSFFIFAVGFFCDSYTKKISLTDEANAEQVNQNENSIQITPSEGAHTVGDDASVPDIIYEDDSTADNSTSNISSDSNIVQPSNNNNNNNIENETTANTAINLDVVNDQLRKEIESEFDVVVKYGSETEGYSVANISTVPITNSSTINNSLVRLKNVLRLYPNGLFKEIKDGGIPLTILLIDNYQDNNITGVTDSSYSYANISIAVSYPFEESFYHESYHYIERYMFKKGANFNTWNFLNPDDFTYGTVYNDLSYSNTFAEDAPFVNNYAQTDDKEDRASTFEYMMASSKASCLNNGQIVWKKAVLMSRTMDAVFNSVSPNVVEYWERFLF